MPAWVKRPGLPLVAAALVFIMLSLAARGPGQAWVVVNPVPAGARIAPGDVRYETIPPFTPSKMAVARMPLLPGMVLGPEFLGPPKVSNRAELSVAVAGVAASAVSTGDLVRLGMAANGEVWLSSRVTVVGVAGGGLGSLSGSLTVTGPPSALLQIVRHDGNPSGTWIVMKVGGIGD